jgi:hypothetical protein
MTGLIRITDRYTSDRTTADTSIKIQMQFIIDNIDKLQIVDRRNTRIPLARKLFEKLIAGEELLEWERGAIDGLYEDTMKGLDFPAVGKHIDKKTRSLRFG